ncbi:MAG: fibronectin type III domain-containing protein [Clostridia bacterium]|nr:fibronectin type III domain-containing protein [Clostridia bacterium]
MRHKFFKNLSALILAVSMLLSASAIALANTEETSSSVTYHSYNRTLSGNWIGSYGKDGYILLGDDTAVAVDSQHTLYTKNIFEGVAEGTPVLVDRAARDVSNTTAIQNSSYKITANSGAEYSGALISRFASANQTWRGNGKAGDTAYAGSPLIPDSTGASTGVRLHGEVANAGLGTATSIASVGHVAFTLTEEAVEDGGVYITVYNPMHVGFSQNVVNYTTDVFNTFWGDYTGGYFYQKNTVTPRADMNHMARATVRVLSQTGYYVTYHFTEAGDYTIVNFNGAEGNTAAPIGRVAIGAVFFDKVAPTSVDPVEEIVPDIAITEGSGTAEFVQTDKYTQNNWEGTYGKDGYYVFDANSKSLTNAPIHTAGIYGDGSYRVMYGSYPGTTGGGEIFWSEYPTLKSDTLVRAVSMTGSLYRVSANGTLLEQGLYRPGTTDKIGLETGSSGADIGHKLPYGIGFALNTDEDVYVTVYAYTNSYNRAVAGTNPAEPRNPTYKFGVVKGNQTAYNLLYNIITDTSVTSKVLCEEVAVEDMNNGKYVTFKISGGAGYYMIYNYDTTSTRNGSGMYAIFFDKEQPVFNAPRYVVSNSMLEEEGVDKTDEFYGKNGSITADGNTASHASEYAFSTNYVSASIADATYRYVSVKVAGNSNLTFYRGYYANSELATAGEKTLEYTVTSDKPIVITFKFADGFSMISSGELIGVYFDNNMPTTYRYKVIGEDRATGSDWESAYGAKGYVIPYVPAGTEGATKTPEVYTKGDFIVDYTIGGSNDVSFQVSNFDESYISNSLYAPGTTDTLNTRFNVGPSGYMAYGFAIEDEVERYVTINMMSWWQESFGLDNPISLANFNVEIFAGSDVTAINAMTPVTSHVIEQASHSTYLTFKSVGAFVVKVSLQSGTAGPIGYAPALAGIFFDEVSDVDFVRPTTYKANITKTGNIVVFGRPHAVSGGDMTLKIYAKEDSGFEVDTVKVNNVVTPLVDGKLVLTGVSSDVAINVTEKRLSAVAPVVDMDDILYLTTNASAMIFNVTLGNASTEVLSYGIVYEGYRFASEYPIPEDADEVSFVMSFADDLIDSEILIGEEFTVKAYVKYLDLTDNKEKVVYSDEMTYTLRDSAVALPDELIEVDTVIYEIYSDELDYEINLTFTAEDISYDSIKLVPVSTGAMGSSSQIRYTYSTGAQFKALPTNGIIKDLKPGTSYNITLKVTDANGKTAEYTYTVSTKAIDYTLSLGVTTSDVTSDSVVLNLTAPSGGVGTLSYEYSLDGGATWSRINNMSYTVAGLQATTAYEIKVRVTDSLGVSDVETVTFTTSAATPETPDTPDVPGGDTPDAPGGDTPETPDAPSEPAGCGGAIAMLSAFMGLIALAVVGKKY